MSPSVLGRIRWAAIPAAPLLASVIAAWLAPAADGGAGPEPDQAATGRRPWTASRVSGSPEPPPPFRVVRVFPELKFDSPQLIVGYPGGGRLVVGEQSGVLSSFVDGPGAKAEVFLDLPREIRTVRQLEGAGGVETVYGLAFHPDFERNRQCFVCYTLRAAEPGRHNLEDGTRVSRFTVTRDDPPRIDPSSEEVVITFLQGGHNGGDLHFGPDGKLYISTGDAAGPNPPDPFETGQDVSDLLSSILRIDVDRRDDGKNYAVPPDNPFVGVERARPEVWAYGLRNPWRMGFDRQTGELFVGDVGWDIWEMIHRVERGGNYGWSAMEGSQPIKTDRVGPTPIHPPLIELPHAIACSVTGGLVYRGTKFPELRGAYVFGDWETRRLWAARFDGDRVMEMPELARPSIRFVAFAEDRDGELIFLDNEGGTLHALERNEGERNVDFPTRLSETGLFASTASNSPAPGVVPFAINSRQWQDGATEEHWAAFPGLSSATLHATGKPIPGLVNWHYFRMHFPKDAVLTRTLSLAGRRVETQMLHYDGADWRAYTFAWRDDQSDADLVDAEGDEREVPDGQGTRAWQFLGRGQCFSCHSNQTEYALAFQPEQLNRPGPDGRNQLVALSEAGYIRRAGDDGGSLPPFDAASASAERRLADPADDREPIEARALAYLHANCGHCHSENGGGAVPLRLQFPTPPAGMNAVDARPTRGDFGLPDARVVRPGDPHASTLYFRMAKFGRDRMPRLGSERPDEAGLELVARWIAGLDGGNGGPGHGPDGPSLDAPGPAMALARQIGRGELDGPARDAALAEAAKLPLGPIRDLFEGYLPSDGARPKTLGPTTRPRAILGLEGSAARGESIFWSAASQCGTCHRVGGRGREVGPDLSGVGKRRSPADLLESLLEPSRRIEPRYATHFVVTVDGRTASGLLVRRDDRELVLRDAQGAETALDAADVEEVRPLRVSMMPEGQLASLTAQEAADLIAYLASLE